MMCFGLVFTEGIAFKNWLNRKLEMLNLKAPVNFQDLVNFSDPSNLECFKCMDKEAINYETSALHISANMCFEKTEVKQKWQSNKNQYFSPINAEMKKSNIVMIHFLWGSNSWKRLWK